MNLMGDAGIQGDVTEHEAGPESIYLYGFVRLDRPLVVSESGVTGPVSEIRGKDVSALVGHVGDRSLRGDRRSLTAHNRVLNEAMSAGSVLPMQFGVVLPDRETLESEVLAACAHEIDGLFRRVEGKAELNVKALCVEDVAIAELVQEDQSIRSRRDAMRGLPDDATYFERIELGKAVAAGLDGKKATWAATILARLTPLAADCSASERGFQTLILNASFLVQTGAMVDFERAVSAVGQELGESVHIKLTGPLAPYSFVSMRLPVKAL
jgi:Gas vesicle synthesis protein GvpL/GvpF